VANGSLITEDRQYEFTNSEGGTILLGRTTNVRVLEVTGLLDMPDKTAGESVAFDRDGGFQASQDFLGIRRVIMTLAIDAASSLEAETKLDELQGVFAYGRDDGVLVFKREGKEARRIVCRAKRSTFPANWDMATGLAKGVVEFAAVDPRVYSNALQSQIIEPAIDTVGRVYPRVYPVVYGSGGQGGILAVQNIGSIATKPLLRIIGPASNAVIRNITQDKYLQLDLTVLDGDFIELDTLTHTVLLNGLTNRRNKLTPLSDWFDFGPGFNDIRFSTSSAGANTQLEIDWRHAWPSA
jgi:hypothetical protein